MGTFKLVVGLIFQPGSISLLLALVGVLARRRYPRTGTTLICCAVSFAWLLSTAAVGSALLIPLERQYPSLVRIPPEVRHVVVLGSSYSPRAGIPVTAAVDDAGLQRLAEGVRLFRQVPGGKLVVSGGSRHPGWEPALGHAMLARDLGVPADSIVILTRPLDTRAEAREITRYLGAQPFLLVTTANHMPRAVEYLRQAGGNPIAAPTGQRSGTAATRIRAWIPSADGLRMSEDAFHEYLGWLALMADIE